MTLDLNFSEELTHPSLSLYRSAGFGKISSLKTLSTLLTFFLQGCNFAHPFENGSLEDFFQLKISRQVQFSCPFIHKNLFEFNSKAENFVAEGLIYTTGKMSSAKFYIAAAVQFYVLKRVTIQ